VKPSIRSAVLLCCATVAAHAQSTPYEFVSRVTGSTDYFALNYLPGDGELPYYPNGATFDITTRALIDYSGGSYIYVPEVNIELTISANGGPALTKTLTGSLQLSSSVNASGTVSVWQSVSGGDFVYFSLDQYFETYLPAGAAYTGLAMNVPFGPTAGSLDYRVTADHQQVFLNWIYADFENSSFTLSPVPEPTTWAMLAAGMLVTGSALRRRRGGQGTGGRGVVHEQA
jgi:hypothetical protein